jgi:ATP-dependent DNA ligase
VITEYGDLGGKMQQVVDTAKAKNVGRSNEVSAEEAAVQQMERTILLKRRKGYREVGEEARPNEVTFDLLPKNLCFYKPDNTLSKTLLKMVDEGTCWFARKRDGEMMVLATNEHGDISIYSRRMLRHHHLEPDRLWTERFPHIVKDVHEVIPPNSIFLGEMVSGHEEDKRWALASIMKSKTIEALQLQMEHGKTFFYCWDVAFWEGEDLLSTLPVRDRYALINEVFWKTNYVLPVTAFDIKDLHDLAHNKSIEANADNRILAMDLAKWWGYEGWIIVDPDGVFGDKAYNFRGKPDRPGKYSGKLKPEFEDDFIAFWNPDADQMAQKQGTWGRGKRQGQVGSVSLFQYNSRGELVYICDCGGGLIKTDAFAEAHSELDHYPMVMKVKYTSRTYVRNGDKTNALQFPRVIDIRTDKDMDECINDRL